MSQKLRSVLDATIEPGQYCFVRLDLNVPLDNGKIVDPGRIHAAEKTLRFLTDRKARVVVAAHLGRPDGPNSTEFSLTPVAEYLRHLLGVDVSQALDVVGPDARVRANRLAPGKILLLENVRFDARETSKKDAERSALAQDFLSLVGDKALFISDGFGVVHRRQASVYDIGLLLPGYAGFLIAQELKVLEKLTVDVQKPYIVVLGGSKVSDKLGVIQQLAPIVDSLIIVGGMTFTFLAAQGHSIGSSLVQEDYISTAQKLLRDYDDTIILPQDIVVADSFSAQAQKQTVSAHAIPEGWMGLDIGPESAHEIGQTISQAATIFWNGPAGVFEFAEFSHGTRSLAQSIVEATGKGAFSVVGGGDSAAAIRSFGLPDEKFAHISTGGGASLELLEGKVLPGVTVLSNKK